MTDIDQAIVEAVLSLRLPEPDNHHDAYHCPYCNTRRDAAETAALAERDAARAEVARLRAAVEDVLDPYAQWVRTQAVRAALAATEDQP